eukprot:Nitzschia sp. Nitz4//scaffold6_size259037//47180//50993//NITZ4_001049-RA/size259037-processed-gene-0.4-mRNA-1//1//CDS//3329556818//925//frame0
MSPSSIAEDAALLEAIDTSATMDLHRSNLLRMQVTELLDECQLDLDNTKWIGDATEYLHMISKTIAKTSFSVQSYQDLADKPVSLKLSGSGSSTLSVQLVGLTRSRLAYTKKSGNTHVLPTFDVKVQIPTDVFGGKDFMNHRYFDKRKVVMEQVAKTLGKKSKQVGVVEYMWTRGMHCPPVLRVQPPAAKKGSKPKFQVYLHFGMKSIDWIPRLRLVPNRQNIKQKGLESQLYNHQLLMDVREVFEDRHFDILVEHKSCQEALVLVQVWALQRGLWRNHDGWDMNTVALLLVYLLRTHKVNPRMTSLQLFNVMLQTWANTNWLGDTTSNKQVQVRAAQGQDMATIPQSGKREILVLPEEVGHEMETDTESLADMYARLTRDTPLSPEDPPTLLELYSRTKCYELGPVFMDPTLTYNYLGSVSPNYTRLLQLHAQRSLDALSVAKTAFDSLFMQPTRFWLQWDMYLRVQTKSSSTQGWETSTRNLLKKLEIGLGNRIKGMRILSTGNGNVSGHSVDSDEYPTEVSGKVRTAKSKLPLSPTGSEYIVLGLAIDPETSQRVVDRGPPANLDAEVKEFVELWGGKAQLRQFKDGAIVQAVVWNDDVDSATFSNADKWSGGYVEKIAKHLIRTHYTSKPVMASIPSLLSAIDSVATGKGASKNPWAAHQDIMRAFDSLASFLRQSSGKSGDGGLKDSAPRLPLPIDAVEPLSPCLRYSELFPPSPHPYLGGSSAGESKVAGALVQDAILIQIKFGPSSKWPTELKAIEAAKMAMLLQLAAVIEGSGNQDFDGKVTVSPGYVDIGYRGYCFRIIVQADPEIRLLQKLDNPSALASALLVELRKKHVLASRHHATVHTVYTLHPSSAATVRMAKRWVASHLLSGLLTDDIVELIVAKIYSEEAASAVRPSTVLSGFVRFLAVLGNHDWAREPFIVNPRGHISEEEYDTIYQLFEKTRGTSRTDGPAMFIIAPYNKLESDNEDEESDAKSQKPSESTWIPSIESPEWVVVTRAVQLAKRSFRFMEECLTKFDDSDWGMVFQESPSSFKSYSLLLRVDKDYIVDSESSSTGGNLSLVENEEGVLTSAYDRSATMLAAGPKVLRQKVYRNLRNDNMDGVLCAWNPVGNLISVLRKEYGNLAVFLYNDMCPEVIGVLWRPGTFEPVSFSAMTSEYRCPVQEPWKSDCLVTRNIGDILREMSERYQDIVVNVRVFDESCLAPFSKRQKVETD